MVNTSLPYTGRYTIGDVVQVFMPRAHNKRGVWGISPLFTTSQEAKFDGATGRVIQLQERGPYQIPLYLVDFSEFDNSRIGIPWQAQWMREEWIEPNPKARPIARAEAATTAAAGANAHGATETIREVVETARETVASAVDAVAGAVGLAHHEAGSHASGGEPAITPGTMAAEIAGGATQGEGWMLVSGQSSCPDGYPIKGNLQSMIFHVPVDTSYRATIPEVCFSRELDAVRQGFRSTRRRARQQQG